MLWLIGFAAAAAYWPGIMDFAAAPRWAALAVLAPACLLLGHVRTPMNMSGPRTCPDMSGISVALWCFLAYAILSLAWAPITADALNEIAKLSILACVFWVGAQANDPLPAYKGFAIGIAISAPIAILQTFGFHPVDTVMPVSGTFGNGNFLGEAAAMILVAMMLSRVSWWWMVGPAICLVLAQQRGAWFGVIVAALVWVAKRNLALAAVALIPGVVALLFLPHHASDGMTERLAIWADARDGLTLFGRGAGQLFAILPEYGWRMTERGARTWHAHNDLIEAVFDYGIGAVFLVLAAALALRAAAERERLVLVTSLAMGIFGFPLHEPATAFLAALALGTAANPWGRLWRLVATSPGHSRPGHTDFLRARRSF